MTTSQRIEDKNMSQTRQPIQVPPKITLKLGVWGRVGLILAVITAIASYVLYHNGVRYKDREKDHFRHDPLVTCRPRLIKFPRMADKLLADHADTNLLALREAISSDKLSLVTAQQIDKAGISLRLDALKNQANQFVAPTRHEVTQAGVAERVQAQDSSWWAQG